jgi:hypothetical protein
MFRIHPKGTGVVCINPDGIQPHQFVTEYLGELYPAYRWCERMDVVEQAQQTFELKPTLPDFYNILLERPRQDPDGYGKSAVHSCAGAAAATVPMLLMMMMMTSSFLKRPAVRGCFAAGQRGQQLLSLVRCQLHVCCGREGWQAGHCSDVGESSC